jgi:eukaryotic-like serine/threonine-protein kinase
VIGEGGMGEVWKARDTRLDRIVALKISKAQFTERFEREARSIAALNHPHICQLYDVVISKDAPNYLVMEFVEGSPLKGPMPVEKAAEYAGQILDALDIAHHKGITHRDLKPANILVTKQGIKLLDFGLAKLQNPLLKEGDSTLTQPLTAQGQILGTLQYMSPEQLQGKEADARSDLFSFGCVLYEMLTGKRAFEGASPASVIAAILERQPAPLTEAPPLDRIVRRTLAKDPDQRFQTARDLKAALTWALEQPAPVPPKPDYRWWIAAAAAALVLILGGGWVVSRFRQPSATSDRATHVQLTPPEGGEFVAFGGSTGGFSLSPDGRTAAYVARVNGKTSLWVRPLDSATARPIPGTEDAGYPFWSPDGKSIAFSIPGKLQRVDVTGGEPLTICDGCGGSGGAWTTDGRIIMNGLRQVSASGGKPSPLTTADPSRGELYHGYPQMLPGGRFLYWASGEKPENRGIYAASLAKPAERVKLMTNDSNAVYAAGGDGKGYLLWLRNSTLMAQDFDPATLKLSGEPRPVADPVGITGTLQHIEVTASAGGQLLYTPNIRNQFTWFDRAGKQLGTLGEAVEYITFRLSPDGKRVAASRDQSGGTDLWLIDIERGLASRFTTSATNHIPVWSPNGNVILYRSFSSSLSLRRKNANGSGDEQTLPQLPGNKVPYDWSRDGHFFIFGQRNDLWILPVTPDGNPAGDPHPYLTTPFGEGSGRFSPEPSPHWIAYASNESGRPEIYVQSFPEPHGKFQISTGGGNYPEWGPGGRELFYVSADNKLMAVSLKLGENSVEPSTPRTLFALPAVDPRNINPYDVIADGQRFLVRVTQPPVLNLIVNWPALLKRGATAQ